MNHNNVRQWNVLCWNIRGLNASRKWDPIRNKIMQANCDVICLQETKKETLHLDFLRKFLPPSFDDFLFVPSVGASGGLLVAWKSSLLSGSLKNISGFSIAVTFFSRFDDTTWILFNVYGPCTPDGKKEFTD
jgi:exonuclease III